MLRGDAVSRDGGAYFFKNPKKENSAAGHELLVRLSDCLDQDEYSAHARYARRFSPSYSFLLYPVVSTDGVWSGTHARAAAKAVPENSTAAGTHPECEGGVGRQQPTRRGGGAPRANRPAADPRSVPSSERARRRENSAPER